MLESREQYSNCYLYKIHCGFNIFSVLLIQLRAGGEEKKFSEQTHPIMTRFNYEKFIWVRNQHFWSFYDSNFLFKSQTKITTFKSFMQQQKLLTVMRFIHLAFTIATDEAREFHYPNYYLSYMTFTQQHAIFFFWFLVCEGFNWLTKWDNMRHTIRKIDLVFFSNTQKRSMYVVRIHQHTYEHFQLSKCQNEHMYENCCFSKVCLTESHLIICTINDFIGHFDSFPKLNMIRIWNEVIWFTYGAHGKMALSFETK